MPCASCNATALIPKLVIFCLAAIEAAPAGSLALANAERWPRADSLLTRDSFWLGGDEATTVDLGDGRILWLFGDSFIGIDSTRDRAHSVMVRNSIAIQYGRDPTNARIRFYWKQAKGRPCSFFPEPRASWLWPTHGLLLGDGLYLFAIKVRACKAGLGFDNFGAVAIRITNPQMEPDRWRMSYLAVPVEVVNGESIGGVGTVLSDSGHLYAWFTYNDQRHNAYLARWQLPLMARKKLPTPEWWTTEGWTKAGGAGPKPLLQFSGAPDFSVQRLDSTGGMLLTHALGFGKTRVSYRTADRITGPWSETRDLHTPAEWSMPDAFMYSANGHPELEGGDVVITYNVNSNWAELVRNRNIYYPRFLRATLVSTDSQLK